MKREKQLKTILLFLICYFLSIQISLNAQTNYFPPLVGSGWDTISPLTLGWCPDKIDSLTNFVGSNNSKAFIILKDGKIVVEKYYGTFTKDSLWYWASAGKTMTSLLTGIAQQEGFLHIDSLTSKYIGQGWTSCPSIKENLITVRHQLTMTTGLDDNVFDDDCTIDTSLKYLSDAGARWAYHNAPYTLLDSVIYYATNQTFQSYFNSKIRNKIGMNGFWFPNGYNNVYYSNARSFARFGLLLLNKATWNNTVVLADTNYFHGMTNTSQNMNESYGYLTWLNGKQSYMLPESQLVFQGSFLSDAPADLFAALGKNGQVINVVPSMNLVLIRMGNAPTANAALPMLLNNQIWQKLNTAMCSNAALINKHVPHKSIVIYPNPVEDLLDLLIDGDVNSYKISQLNGSVILSGATFPVNVSKLKTGIYFLEFEREKIKYHTKFLKE